MSTMSSTKKKANSADATNVESSSNNNKSQNYKSDVESYKLDDSNGAKGLGDDENNKDMMVQNKKEENTEPTLLDGGKSNN